MAEPLVVVRPLTSAVNRGHLQEIFGEYGKVVEVKIMRYFLSRNDARIASDRCKMQGFIEYPDLETAQKAVDYMDGAVIDGETITARLGNTKFASAKQGRGGGGGKRRRGRQGGRNRRGGGGGRDRRSPSRSSPKVLAALAQLAQVLQKKGHMDLSDPRPPSPMKMMRVMGDAEVREAVAGMQRAMCDENIEFSATNLMAILRARGNGWASAGKDVRDPVEQSNVKPGAAAGEAKGLFSRVSGMFKSDAK
ncbi:hypothetical protein LPJ61_000757 [Coemansia biformis]|uniref:RRM domain-containing protein n=1 Tax=Coemansia biformis TaxID=1286918 RepID=A0A9W8D084_9FUNG|nr:hypothetical protein LPJ61_000757 [Coemansia biformis]